MLEGRKILLVEDEMLVVMLLETILENAGCVVTSAGHLEKAVELATSQPIDAAVIDVNLHGDSSYPVANTLIERGIPIIFATGYGDSELSKLYPARPVLTKPYRPAQLIAALTAMLEGPATQN